MNNGTIVLTDSTSAKSANRSGLQDTGTAVPLPVVLFLIMVILVPIEFSFNIGTLSLTASRAYLFVLAFIVLPKMFQLKLQLFDWFFIGHVLWTCTAYILIYPPGQAVERAGSYGLEFLITYMMARIYLQRVEQMRATILLIFAFVLLSGIFAFPEAMTGVRYVHEFAEAVTGNTYRLGSEIRMGIYRAHSFFEHPILYGVFCASSFGLVWFMSTPLERLYRAPIIIVATWVSASSAPILTLLVQILLVAVEWVTRQIKRRDKWLAWATGIFVIAIETFTGRGIAGTVALITINPGTAYTRRSQWNFAIDDVMRNAWFGFRPETYTRPFWLAPSIDNWWLLIMMRAGIPSLVLLALAALFVWIAIARREGPLLFNQLRTAWGLMMIAVILGAATVTFFGKLQPLFAFYMGMGAALAVCFLPSKDEKPNAPTGRQGVVYTRFSNQNAAFARARGTAPLKRNQERS